MTGCVGRGFRIRLLGKAIEGPLGSRCLVPLSQLELKKKKNKQKGWDCYGFLMSRYDLILSVLLC